MDAAEPPRNPDAPAIDMAITVGWNTAQKAGITREEMDAWAVRSHERAIAAIDEGRFVDEILPIKVELADGSITEFAVDEFPRRGTTMEALAGLKVLHPEIEDSPSPRATAPASTTPPPPSRSSVTTSPLRRVWSPWRPLRPGVLRLWRRAIPVSVPSP